jgi:hypothetical protein
MGAERFAEALGVHRRSERNFLQDDCSTRKFWIWRVGSKLTSCGHGAQRCCARTWMRLRAMEARLLFWVELRLNPHPLKAKGAAPKSRLWAEIVRTWGEAVLRPYIEGLADEPRLCLRRAGRAPPLQGNGRTRHKRGRRNADAGYMVMTSLPMCWAVGRCW